MGPQDPDYLTPASAHDRRPQSAPPDVVLLAAEWQPRALIRAQLIEEGLEVVAADSWPMMRRHLRPGLKPRLAIVDLKGLANADGVLGDLRTLMPPGRVLVVTALGSRAALDVARAGFNALSRPIAIGDVVRAARAMIQDAATCTRNRSS